MSSGEPVEQESLADVSGIAVAPSMQLVPWEQCAIVGSSEGHTITIFHGLPAYNPQGEFAGHALQPIAHYSISGDRLVQTAGMFIRQAIAWASDTRADEGVALVEESLKAAIAEGLDQAEELKRARQSMEDGGVVDVSHSG